MKSTAAIFNAALLSLSLLCIPVSAADKHEEVLLKKQQLDRICRIGGDNIKLKTAKVSFLYDEYVINVDDERCGISLRYAVTVYRSNSWAEDELKEQMDIVTLGALPLSKPDPERDIYYSETSPTKALFLIRHDNVYLNISYSLKNKEMTRPIVRLLKQLIDHLYSVNLKQSGF